MDTDMVDWIDCSFIFNPEGYSSWNDLVHSLRSEVYDFGGMFDAVMVFDELTIIDLTGCIDSEVL